MEIERPDAKVPRYSMMVIILGLLVLDVLIAGYVQIAASMWIITIVTFAILIVVDTILVVSFLRRKAARPESSQE
jgi:membrane protein implicated in regulation of membrane protease activity